MRVSAKGLEYPNKYYWDIIRNPYASVLNGLADCTCYCYGAVIEDGHRPVVSRVCNANNYHQFLINGWWAIPYDVNRLEKGDIIEWSTKCHVAVYTGNNEIAGSFYTGMHGKAYWNGKFDTRSFKTLQEMSDWMVANYPTRLFHHWAIEEESRWCGGKPDYILKHPLYSVEQNPSVDQIYVSGDDMNVRNDSNEILKRAEKGYYNVLRWKDNNGYRWYEVEKGKYIAGVESRVTFIPKQEDVYVRLQELEKENAELKERLEEINRISCLK